MYDTSGTFYGTPGTYLWRAKLIASRADPLCDAENLAAVEREQPRERGQAAAVLRGPSPPPRGARGPDEADRQRNGGRAGEPVGVDREFTAAGAAVSHLVYKEGGSCYSVGKAGLQ